MTTRTPANTIVERVFDFLEGHAPFRLLPPEALRAVAASVEVRFVAADAAIFSEGDPPGARFYAVKDGSVDLLREGRLVDICEEGDVFGVRAMVGGQPYAATARAREETLLYAVDNATFRPLLAAHPRVALFFAAGFAAGVGVLGHGLGDTRRGLHDLSAPTGHIPPMRRVADLASVQPRRALVHVAPDTPIRAAARLMTDEGVGSLLMLDAAARPIGIFTDTDLRRRVATGEVPVDAPVSHIMSAPVVTVGPDRPVAELLMTMMRSRCHHLCVTEDGTPASPALGVVSQHDVTLRQGDDPAVLITRVRKARSLEALPPLAQQSEALLHDYLAHDVDIVFVGEVLAAISDAIVARAAHHAAEALEREGLPSPGLRWAWLSLGSEGRQEQLLRTDQDNALVYEDPPEGCQERAQRYFLALAERVNQVLLDCGFSACPADMMARNPRWNLPLSGWRDTFRGWITTPTPKAVMLSTIFFDFRAVAGAGELADQLSADVRELLAGTPRFFAFLADNALQSPPPLSFFRGFVVERSGEHKDSLDIKLRGMMPLTDAARVLTLQHLTGGGAKSDPHHTARRFRQLATLEPKHAGLFEEAAMAYQLLLRFRANSGLARGDSGRYLDPQGLNKLERHTLKHAFRPLVELQEVLRVRFQTDQLRR